MKSKNISVRLDKASESTIDLIQSLPLSGSRSAIINEALHLYYHVLVTDNPLKKQIKELNILPYCFTVQDYEKRYKNQ